MQAVQKRSGAVRIVDLHVAIPRRIQGARGSVVPECGVIALPPIVRPISQARATESVAGAGTPTAKRAGDAITITRRIIPPSVAYRRGNQPVTTRMERVDPQLMAMARGDVAPDGQSETAIADAESDAGEEIVVDERWFVLDEPG